MARMFDGSFEELVGDAVITKSTGFDYSTQTATETTQTVGVIRKEFLEKLIDGENVKIGDYKLVGQYVDLEFEPSPDNCKIAHAGIILNLVGFENKSGIAFILHVRRA